MVNNLTGREFTPNEFRALNQCVNCGRAENIEYGAVCATCAADELPRCGNCEKLIRNGDYLSFSYDDRPEQPWNTKVKEYAYIETHSDALDEEGFCKRCVWPESRMKNKCFDCKREFGNTRDNFKKNGNLCGKCAEKYDNQDY